MRRPLSILATVGIIVMCALILLGTALPIFIPTSRFIYVGGVGPLGFQLYRFGIYVTEGGVKWFSFSVFLPAAVLGTPSVVYLMLGSMGKKRETGFTVIQETESADRPA